MERVIYRQARMIAFLEARGEGGREDGWERRVEKVMSENSRL
jgi:hypothetical protein